MEVRAFPVKHRSDPGTAQKKTSVGGVPLKNNASVGGHIGEKNASVGGR